MSRYLPYTIYENVQKLLTYRQLLPIEPMSERDFIEKIQIEGYVIINTSDAPTKVRKFTKASNPLTHSRPVQTYIIIVEPNNKVGQASADFEKMLKHVPISKRPQNIEILIITKELFKPNIVSKIDTLVQQGDANDGYLQITNLTYNNFIIVIPEHCMVPPHRILNDTESAKVLAQTFSKKRDIPKILKSDPINIWYGGVTGDIYEILVPSENVGTEVHYRCVI